MWVPSPPNGRIRQEGRHKRFGARARPRESWTGSLLQFCHGSLLSLGRQRTCRRSVVCRRGTFVSDRSCASAIQSEGALVAGALSQAGIPPVTWDSLRIYRRRYAWHGRSWTKGCLFAHSRRSEREAERAAGRTGSLNGSSAIVGAETHRAWVVRRGSSQRLTISCTPQSTQNALRCRRAAACWISLHG
jgi:hypothetical protein